MSFTSYQRCRFCDLAELYHRGLCELLYAITTVSLPHLWLLHIHQVTLVAFGMYVRHAHHHRYAYHNTQAGLQIGNALLVKTPVKRKSKASPYLNILPALHTAAGAVYPWSFIRP
jgi:hypothetical protein